MPREPPVGYSSDQLCTLRDSSDVDCDNYANAAGGARTRATTARSDRKPAYASSWLSARRIADGCSVARNWAGGSTTGNSSAYSDTPGHAMSTPRDRVTRND